MRGDRTFVELMLALMLVAPSLGCAGYGVLLHSQVIAPPILNVKIGLDHLISEVSTPLPCVPGRRCLRSGPALAEPPTIYSVWVFIADTDQRDAPHAILLLHLRSPLR
jgi:hypothetical protein